MKHVWIVVNTRDHPMMWIDGQFWNNWPCPATVFTSYESARNHLRKDKRSRHWGEYLEYLADRIVRLDVVEE